MKGLIKWEVDPRTLDRTAYTRYYVSRMGWGHIRSTSKLACERRVTDTCFASALESEGRVPAAQAAAHAEKRAADAMASSKSRKEKRKGKFQSNRGHGRQAKAQARQP